ncbi:leucine zipper transcription factor-like protein 1 isoform X2 [Rhincodon typus]|uniref:leucine zipper transcription factor-like protein 1 isoform X2 n=1 Tax=Rhincodon typus TaxID=259920 RepID=UPI00202EAEFB|nr:leucine zipper transcription factor-like protein 1 isoform X2 [Rhincodon typus]
MSRAVQAGPGGWRRIRTLCVYYSGIGVGTALFVYGDMAELGLNEHHQNAVINYMRFARSKRALRLKTVDSCFEDLKDSRLTEDTFTVDEVGEMLDGLKVVVHSEVESELINTAYTNVLLLRQLFCQAEKWYLKLQTDISDLENRELLEQVAEFEKAEFTSSGKKANAEITKPKLAPLNEGVSELLSKEITRLQDENDKLKARLKTVEIQATNALEEKLKLEQILNDLDKVPEDEKEVAALEKTLAALKADFEKNLSMSTAKQKSLQDNLISTKHDLLKVQEHLSLTEKELDKKFQETAAYRNMKEILTKKNEQVKELRKRLSKYEAAD